MDRSERPRQQRPNRRHAAALQIGRPGPSPRVRCAASGGPVRLAPCSPRPGLCAGLLAVCSALSAPLRPPGLCAACRPLRPLRAAGASARAPRRGRVPRLSGVPVPVPPPLASAYRRGASPVVGGPPFPPLGLLRRPSRRFASGRRSARPRSRLWRGSASSGSPLPGPAPAGPLRASPLPLLLRAGGPWAAAPPFAPALRGLGGRKTAVHTPTGCTPGHTSQGRSAPPPAVAIRPALTAAPLRAAGV